MPSLTTYKLLKQEHDARRGEFKTVHGTVQTPAFQNVATAGAIKGGLSAQDLKDIGAQVMLCNTYHLHLRPGDKLVADMGGLHKFTRWNGEDQDRHLIDMPHAAFAAMPPERVADFAAKYGHLGLHWMQVGAQNADGLCYYDIVRGGMDKGVGLADLCEKMGLTLADAVAAGDSANDVAMLKAAGLGCCMANGTPDAKAAADRIIGDVREDGLADLIDELWFDGPRAEPSGRDLGSPWDKIESAGGQ